MEPLYDNDKNDKNDLERQVNLILGNNDTSLSCAMIHRGNEDKKWRCQDSEWNRKILVSKSTYTASLS